MNLANFIEDHRDQHLAELYEFLRIPSVSAKSEHKPDIERAAGWVAGRLRAAGFKKVEIVPTSMHPLVYAESLEAPGKPTILFYGHYDVQPAEPLDLWTSPAFDPTVRNGNLFGRGTADDKGQVHIHLKALEALQKVNGRFPINIKVLIEGEEEVGSVSLWDFVQKNRAKLKADALVVYDTVAKVSNAERKSLNALPWKKKDFEKAVGAPGYFGEKGFTTIERLWTRPTFELN